MQVTVCDARQGSLDVPGGFICYDLADDEMTGVYVREGVSDEILCGLGLPFEKDFPQEGKEVVRRLSNHLWKVAVGQGVPFFRVAWRDMTREIDKREGNDVHE